MQKKKGISLIVLVITIIVMIILATAIIISLNNSGIIGKANKAVQDTNEQEVNHIASLAWSEAYLNGARTEGELTSAINTSLTNNGIDISKYLITVTTKGVTVKDKSKVWVQNGLNITKGDVTLEAGDLIQYNAGVEGYEGEWKVLGAENGNLLILSTDYILEQLELIGLNGGTYKSGNTTYESDYGLINGLKAIRNECNKYKYGTGAVGARCVKEDDINKLTEFNPIEQNDTYGTRFQFKWNSNNEGIIDYTNLEDNTNGSLNVNHNSGFIYINPNSLEYHIYQVNENNIPIIQYTYYNYTITDTSKTSITLDSEKASEMIIGKKNSYGNYTTRYMLDNLITNYTSAKVAYGLKRIGGINSNSILSGMDLIYSDGKNEYANTNIRAVVELSPNITIGEKDNTLGWSYTV